MLTIWIYVSSPPVHDVTTKSRLVYTTDFHSGGRHVGLWILDSILRYLIWGLPSYKRFPLSNLFLIWLVKTWLYLTNLIIFLKGNLHMQITGRISRYILLLGYQISNIYFAVNLFALILFRYIGEFWMFMVTTSRQQSGRNKKCSFFL